MNFCHLLLGRPWQFDVDLKLNNHDNAVLFTWNNHKIVIAHISPSDALKTKNTSFLILTSNEEEIKDAIKKMTPFQL